METSLLIALVLLLPVVAFGIRIRKQLKRGQIYRADRLVRSELNRMHRHTLWTVLLCVAMLVIAGFVPSTRVAFGISALIMLFGILPLRTIFIEKGIRFNRNGKPQSTPDHDTKTADY